jgi:hypothetical protein
MQFVNSFYFMQQTVHSIRNSIETKAENNVCMYQLYFKRVTLDSKTDELVALKIDLKLNNTLQYKEILTENTVYYRARSKTQKYWYSD